MAEHADDEGRALTGRGERTREELLDAAARLLDRTPAADLLPPLSAVAKEAHRSEGSAKYAFGDRAGLHEALVRERAVPAEQREAIEALPALVDALAEVLAAEPSVRVSRLIGETAREHLESVEATPGGVRRMLLFVAAALGPDGGDLVPAVKSELIDSVMDPLVEAYDRVLSAWGRHVRPPFDTRSFAVLLMALTDGTLVRRSIDDEATSELFESAVRALIAVFTAPEADDRSVEELLDGAFRPPAGGVGQGEG